MCVDVYISTATLENNQPCIGHTFCDLAYKHDIIQTYTHNTSPLLDTSGLQAPSQADAALARVDRVTVQTVVD